MTRPRSLEPGPSTLILARAAAFRRCDFGFIFDTYHTDSNFRRQFSDRDDYISYGWASLGKDFRILDCTVIRETVDGSAARVIFSMEIELHQVRQRYAELAWLEHGSSGWLYRCGQKLIEKEWPVPVSQLDERHFHAVTDRIFY